MQYEFDCQEVSQNGEDVFNVNTVFETETVDKLFGHFLRFARAAGFSYVTGVTVHGGDKQWLVTD